MFVFIVELDNVMIGKDFYPSLRAPVMMCISLSTCRLFQKSLVTGRHRTRLGWSALAMVFEKPSLRTRVSFEVGIGNLVARRSTSAVTKLVLESARRLKTWPAF